MQIDLYRASADEQQIIGNLIQLYSYEFSTLCDTDVEYDGLFDWDGLEDYWNDTSLHPFLCKVKQKIAGFALIQRLSVVTGATNVWDMEDFFILEKYKRNGVGSAMLSELFREFTGQWEIRVLNGNNRALEFWNHVISKQCGASVQPAPTLINGRKFDVFSFEVS